MQSFECWRELPRPLKQTHKVKVHLGDGWMRSHLGLLGLWAVQEEEVWGCYAGQIPLPLHRSPQN